MGSYCDLKFDQISIISNKSYVPDDFICLFQEDDRRSVIGEDHEDEYVRIGYFAERSVIIERLDLMGYTAKHGRNHFEEWLNRERETYSEYEKDDDQGLFTETAAALRAFSYEEWLSRVKEVLLTRYKFDSPSNGYRDEIDRRMRDPSDGWLFYDLNVLPIIRSLLIAFPEIKEVSLDISDLVGGGWISEDEKICSARRRPDLQPRSDLQPTVIIAEGSTDMAVLKSSLKKLYPYLADYFAFFDYESPRVDAGASYLLKFLRAFAAARINTDILAIFDNDAEGTSIYASASSIPFPTNIKIMKLPNIELACAYPTLGPQGSHRVDINGKAVSIELFLGLHNLSNGDGGLFPIVWSSLVSGSRQYQGAIQEKRSVFLRFMEEISQNNTADYYRSRFPELATLWRNIFSLRRDIPRIVELSDGY